MKKIGLLLFLLFAFQVPLSSYAADSNMPDHIEISDIFKKPEKDISVEFLGNIFGQVSPGLDEEGLTSSSRIWRDAFRYFNHIALVVGLILLLYSVIVGTLQTATSGKILGEKWSSTWLPIRSVAGIALLMPTATGYCLAQVIIMWVVFWGSTAASTIWGATLDYLDTNPLYPKMDRSAEDLNNLAKSMGNAKKTLVGAYGSLACVTLHNHRPGNEDEQYSYRRSMSDDQVKSEYFGYQERDKGYGRECGEIRVDSELQLYELHNMVSLLQPIAEKIKDMNPRLPEVKLSPKEREQLDTLWKALPDNMKTASGKVVDSNSHTDLKQLKEFGWVVAGNYYRQIAKNGSQTGGTIDAATFSDPQSTAISHDYEEFKDPENIEMTNKIKAGEEKFGLVLDDILSNVVSTSKGQSHAKELYDKSANFQPIKLGGWWYTLGLRDAFFELTKPILDALGGTFNSPGDPFASAVILGRDMMRAAAAIVTTALLIGNALFATAANICRAQNPAGPGAHTVQSTISAMILGIAGFLYTQGVMLGIYLPLIPFVIFIVGVIGWIICVFESIVAAPLVAIGLIWPDAQNEVLGRAEPAVMLMLNLFLRPSLMILGLVAGTLVCWVGFQLTNLGFRTMMANHEIGYEPTFGWLALGFIYAMLLIAIAKKCYSLIHHVPDKVLHWIGDSSQGVGGADEIVSATQSGSEKGASSAGGFASTVGQHVGYGGDDLLSTGRAHGAMTNAMRRRSDTGSSGTLSSE